MSNYKTPEWERNNARLQKEINANKIEIDRSEFKKTDEEKLQLANAKQKFKNSLK